MRKKARDLNREENEADSKRRWVDYSSVGLMFPVSIAVGFAMGYGLDQWLDTEPIFMVVLSLYGVAAGFVNLFKVTRKK